MNSCFAKMLKAFNQIYIKKSIKSWILLVASVASLASVLFFFFATAKNNHIIPQYSTQFS